jgi:hypothetical protein
MKRNRQMRCAGVGEREKVDTSKMEAEKKEIVSNIESLNSELQQFKKEVIGTADEFFRENADPIRETLKIVKQSSGTDAQANLDERWDEAVQSLQSVTDEETARKFLTLALGVDMLHGDDDDAIRAVALVDSITQSFAEFLTKKMSSFDEYYEQLYDKNRQIYEDIEEFKKQFGDNNKVAELMAEMPRIRSPKSITMESFHDLLHIKEFDLIQFVMFEALLQYCDRENEARRLANKHLQDIMIAAQIEDDARNFRHMSIRGR